jgi:hypothetical protein
MKALARTLALTTLAISAWAGASSSTLDADTTLDNIKDALLDQAMDTGVSLRGLSYIDGSGRLQEAQLFQSTAQVKGMQVAAYLEAAGVPTSQLAAPVNLSQQCPWQGVSHAQPSVGVSVTRVHAPNAANDANFAVLESFLRERSVQFLSHAELRAQNQPNQYTPKATTFAKFAYGVGQRVTEPTFSLQWNVRFAKGTPQTIRTVGQTLAQPFKWVSASVEDRWPYDSRSFSHPSHKLMLDATLVHNASGRTVWEDTFGYRLPSLSSTFSEAQILKQLERGMSRELDKSVQSVVAQIHCTPPLYTATIDHQKGLKVRAGAIDGIRQGQWLLAGDKSLLSENWLTDDNLNSLVIYEAVQVDQYESVLRPVTETGGQRLTTAMLLPL